MRSFYTSPEVILYLLVLVTLFKPYAYCRETFEKQQQQHQQESQREVKIFAPRSIMKRASIPPGLMHTFLKLDGNVQTGGKRRGVLPRTKLEAYLQASLNGRTTMNRKKLNQLFSAGDEKRREISTKSTMFKVLPFFSSDGNTDKSSQGNAKKAEFPYARPGKREMDADLNRALIQILLRLLSPGHTEKEALPKSSAH